MTNRLIPIGLWMLSSLLILSGSSSADDQQTLSLDDAVRERCVDVLRQGLHDDDFWPSIHAAEALTLGGHGDEVIAFLTPRLETETDLQRRCGLAREIVRAGDRSKVEVMLGILAGDDPYGHVHAAESLYKVAEIGDGAAMRRAFEQTDNLRFKIMLAAALGRCGNPAAMTFLRETLDNDDPEVFRLAAWVLGRIGDESDIPRLKKLLPRCKEDLPRAFVNQSLAALGDADGLAAVVQNLSSDDPAVRTYAAVFAGEARAVDAANRLIALLDDSTADVRYRAAQALLELSSSSPLDPNDDVSTIVYQATTAHPRYTEGSVLELNDGSLLFAVTEFAGSGSDFAQARIVSRRSTDGGRTWDEPRVLQENTGGMNVMSVTLRRLADGRVALFYLQKNSKTDLDLLVRFSEDDAKTFGQPTLVTADDGYHVVNNDRVTQLSTGRLLAPTASTGDVEGGGHFVCHCYISDDGGESWHNGSGTVDAAKRGAMEPEVIELDDGRVMMLIRNQLGSIGKSYSEDGGETWSEMTSLGPQAPEAPSTVRRVPSTGDLLLIWNNTYEEGAGHGGQRTPLTAAISADEGQTWHIVGDLESNPQQTYSYPSLTFAQTRAVMSYWESEGGQYSCRFRSLPVSWFYK